MTSVITRRLGSQSFNIETFGDGDPFTAAIVDGYGDELHNFCVANMSADAVAIDIGANLGLTACILSQVARRVVAFEPSPMVFEKLLHNLMANGVGNVEAHQMAVGSNAGEVRFDGTSAFGHVVEDGGTAVPVDTVDALVAQLGLDRVDFIKIDVEGFEPHVLEGARRTIERFDPIIYMEFNSWCLMDVGRVNPMEFARTICDRFRTVELVEQGTGRTTRVDARGIVYRNVTTGHSVDDLVLIASGRSLQEPASEPVAAETEVPVEAIPRRSAVSRLWAKLTT